MSLERKKVELETRISILKGRRKDNNGVIRKLERQLRNVNKELGE